MPRCSRSRTSTRATAESLPMVNAVDPSYFDGHGPAARRGPQLQSDADNRPARPTVAVVNEALARALLAGAGRRSAAASRRQGRSQSVHRGRRRRRRRRRAFADTATRRPADVWPSAVAADGALRRAVDRIAALLVRTTATRARDAAAPAAARRSGAARDLPYVDAVAARRGVRLPVQAAAPRAGRSSWRSARSRWSSPSPDSPSSRRTASPGGRARWASGSCSAPSRATSCG